MRRKLKLQSFEALEDFFWCFSLTLCHIARSTSVFYFLPNPTTLPLRQCFCYAPTLILLVYMLNIRKRPKKRVQSFMFLTKPALLPPPSHQKKNSIRPSRMLNSFHYPKVIDSWSPTALVLLSNLSHFALILIITEAWTLINKIIYEMMIRFFLIPPM